VTQLPEFTEAHHPMVRSLLQQSDHDLVQGFQHFPEQGQFFTAIFCRYGALSYSLLRYMARSSLQVDYLFARMWRNTFYELKHLSLASQEGDRPESFSLQTWIVNKTAVCINQGELPAIETVQYSLRDAPPPLWCYLQVALEQLPALLRLILVLSETFHWQPSRIAGVLAAEGERMEPAAIPQKIEEAYHQLQQVLPKDIQTIYAQLLHPQEPVESW
jgi:hypothetical protein